MDVMRGFLSVHLRLNDVVTTSSAAFTCTPTRTKYAMWVSKGRQNEGVVRGYNR